MDEALISPESTDRRWKQSIRRRLLAWFRRHARLLPWRGTRDPYRVWVSEIMLQQTQVATVVPYFERFVARFPDIASLAAADEQDVLRLWEGLGYYRRARQLHAAANQVVTEHEGEFPVDFESVVGLPGIGRYTAGAVLSIACDQRLPILEANSTRVLCRLAGYRGDPAKSAGQRFLWQLAEDLLPRKDVGDFNQALMELGSQICSPRNPRCDECPVRSKCATCSAGLQDEIPVKNGATKFQDVREAAVVVRRDGKVLMRQCAADERWAGLWDFPRFAVQSRTTTDLNRELVERVVELTGVSIGPLRRLTTMKHGVTRFRITLLCFEARYASGRIRRGQNLRWLRPAQFDEVPLNVTGRRIGRLLAAR